MGERRGRRRVGQVVGGHVDGLDRRDRALRRRRDALLELPHLGRQRGLVAHRAGHAPEERRDLGARLHEPEDVVDEEQHVLVSLVAEVLGHREAREADPQARAGRLVHLAVDERRLRDDARLGHLEPQVVALAAALAHAGEHGEAAVDLGDVVDQLEDQHRLADAGAAEQPHLAALHVRRQEVDDLDPGLEDLGGRAEAVERRRLAVDRPALALLDRVALVDRLAEDVEDPPERPLADGHRDRAAGVDHVEAAGQAVGRVHRDRPHPAVAQVLLHLGHEPPAVGQRDLERVVDRGQAAREDGVDDDTLDLDDPADVRGLAVLGQCDSLCGGRGTGNPAPGAGSYHSGTSTGSDFVTRRGRHERRLLGRAPPISPARRERSSAAATRAAWSRCQTRDETAEIIGMPVR